jgi:large subunit ribosomal protein L21
MFAIIQSGGKQYRVAKDEKIIVENLNCSVGDKIKLEVLFASNDNGEAVFGNPNVKGAVVEAEVVKNFKDDKIIVFKKRRRQNSRRKNGHRQLKTQLKIINIKL